MRAALAILLTCAWGACAAGLLPAKETDAALAGDRLCTAAVAAPAPLATTVVGCRRAWCTQAPPAPQSLTGSTTPAERLCLCETGERSHTYLRGTPGKWLRHRAEASPMLGPEAFGLRLAPIGRGGAVEWLIHHEQSVSNGLGVAYGRLCTWAAGRRAPTCRDTEEWGALSVLIQESGRNTCSLLEGAWRPGREPGQSNGTYAVGRVLRFEAGDGAATSGHWKDSGRPAVVRRLSNAFMSEREDLPERNRTQLWTQDPAARALKCPDRALGDLCRRER